MKLAELYTQITVRDKKAITKLDSFRGRLESVSNGMQTMGRIGQATFLGLAGVIGLSVRASANQEMAEAKLSAAIKSTGKAAGLSAKELKAYASELQEVSTFGDDAIISAEALLLTFTQIKGVNFKSAIQSILDITTLMGGELKDAAIQVGKALNDPITGISSLTRVGITFNQTQKDTIKNLVETGRMAEAQRVILAELSKQFGGQAAAAADTFTGRLIRLVGAIGDVSEVIGDAFKPELISAIAYLKSIVPVVREWALANKPLILQIGKWGLAISGLMAVFAPMAAAVAAFVAGSAALPAMLVGMAALAKVTAVVAAAFAGWKIGEWIREAVSFDGILERWNRAIDLLKQKIAEIREFFGLGEGGAITAAIQTVGSAVGIGGQDVEKSQLSVQEKSLRVLQKIELLQAGSGLVD